MRVKLKGNGAFTLVEIMIVVGIIGLLAAIAVPNIVRHRTYAQQQTCIKNLSTLESAKQLWGVELGKKDGDLPSQAELIGPVLYIKEMPRCPSGGSYEIKAIGEVATCTIEGHTL